MEGMKRVRGRVVDGVRVVLIGSSCDETGRRDLDEGGSDRATRAEPTLAFAPRRLRRRNMRKREKENRSNMMVSFSDRVACTRWNH